MEGLVPDGVEQLLRAALGEVEHQLAARGAPERGGPLLLHAHVGEILLPAAEHAHDGRLVRGRQRARRATRVGPAQTGQVVGERRDEKAAQGRVHVVHHEDVLCGHAMPIVVVHHVAANVPPQQLLLRRVVRRQRGGRRDGPRTCVGDADLVEEILVEPRLHLVHVGLGGRDKGGEVPARGLVPLRRARTKGAHERMVVGGGVVDDVRQVVPLRPAGPHRIPHVNRGDGLRRLVALVQATGGDRLAGQCVVKGSPRADRSGRVRGRAGEEAGDLKLVALVVHPASAQRGGLPEAEHVKTVLEAARARRGRDKKRRGLWQRERCRRGAGKSRQGDAEVGAPDWIGEPRRGLNRQTAQGCRDVHIQTHRTCNSPAGSAASS